MSSRLAIMALGVVALAAAAPSQAQDDPSQGLPGSVFAVPAPQGEVFEGDNEAEILTDMPIFLQRGYSEPDWDAHSNLVGQVARDLVLPDYVKRTGQPVPESPSIEIASAQITKKGFNDLVVRSRLPGDCDANGCLVQIYAMEGQTWTKKLEFKALGVALKDGGEPETTLVAAVGDQASPSHVIVWDGSRFNE